MKTTRWKPIAAVAAITVALTGCAGGGGGGGDGTAAALRLGVLSDVTDWDPAQAHVGHLLQPYQVAYDTLILREPDGELVPMLATEWEYDDTNTVLTMELRDDVTFSDDAVFDADAVVANFEHFQAENGRQAAQLRNLESVTAIDDDTVEIALTSPDPAFTYFLSQAAGLMGSPAALDGDEIGGVPVGSGPYVMDAAATVAGSQFVFTAREDYWNPDLQQFGSVTLRVLTDPTSRVNALVSGQVDATLADSRSAAQAEGAGFTLVDSQVDWHGLLLLDRDGNLVPELGDVRVRQALNHAIDREALLETVQLGYGSTTSQPFGPESGAFDETLEEAYPYDPELARSLLAEAGYAEGFTLRVPLATIYEPSLVALRQQFSEIGVSLELVPVADADYLTEITSGDYPAVAFNLFQGVSWVAIEQIVSTDSLYNVLDSTTPELEQLIEQVRTAPTVEEGDVAATEINRYIVEQAWFMPIYRPDQLYYVADAITVEPQVQMAVPSIYNFAPAN